MIKSKRGYSLAELLVTVAITGTLAALAVPGMSEFQKKARRGQAKTTLGSIYMAEKVFNLEFGSYTTRFDTLGYTADGTLYFNVGFMNDFAAIPPGAPTGTANCRQLCPTTSCPNGFATWKCETSALNSLDGNVHSSANANGFIADAHLHWSTGANFKPETWTIDHLGRMFFIVPAN